jgi:hypothetical protein
VVSAIGGYPGDRRSAKTAIVVKCKHQPVYRHPGYQSYGYQPYGYQPYQPYGYSSYSHFVPAPPPVVYVPPPPSLGFSLFFPIRIH